MSGLLAAAPVVSGGLSVLGMSVPAAVVIALLVGVYLGTKLKGK